jgi:SHS2 domain-containing protein
MSFAIIDHTADTGIAVESDSFPGLYADACRGLITLIYGSTGEGGTEHPVAAEEENFEETIAELLRRLLLLAETGELRILDVRVDRADEHSCSGIAAARPLKPDDTIETSVKAVTYHGLALERNRGILKTSIVFDV